MRTISRSKPINLDHPVNRGLIHAWLALPGGIGVSQWRDPVGGNHTDWVNPPVACGAVSRQGGFGSLLFDGTNDYGNCVKKAAVVTGGSVSLWVNQVGNADTQAPICQTDYTTGDVFNWLITATNVRFRFGGVGPMTVNADTGAGLAANIWTHLCGTYDKVTTEVNCYVNGILLGQGFSGGQDFYDSANVELEIGDYGAGASHGNYWNGFIDEVMIRNRALTKSEVVLDYLDSRRGHPETWNWLGAKSYFFLGSTVAAPGGNRRRRVLMGAAA